MLRAQHLEETPGAVDDLSGLQEASHLLYTWVARYRVAQAPGLPPRPAEANQPGHNLAENTSGAQPMGGAQQTFIEPIASVKHGHT